MVDNRRKGSGSRSRVQTRGSVVPKLEIASPEVPPDDLRGGEIAKNDLEQVEEMVPVSNRPLVVDELVGDVRDEAVGGGENDSPIDTNDFIVRDGDIKATNEANNVVSEEVIDSGRFENNEKIGEEDHVEDGESRNSSKNSPELITGVMNDNEALPDTSLHVETDVEPEGGDEPVCATDVEGVNDDVEEGLSISKEGEQEGVTENVENGKEVNEGHSEVPRSASLNNGVEKTVHENSRVSDEVKAVAEKLSRPKKTIVRKKIIKKKKVVGKIVVAEGEPINGAESRELCKQDNDVKGEGTEHVEKAEKAAVKSIANKNKRKRLRKKFQKPDGLAPSSVEVACNEQNPKPAEADPVCEEVKETAELEMKSGKVETSKNKSRRLRRLKIKGVEEGTQKADVKVEENTQKMNALNEEKPESSKKGKSSSKTESMGMIFMCSSETKKDCYKYNVLGLPAAKKDIVSKIYKGMRLFLFDVNLKMLYGIYKAVAPGGYNIEPRAFKSQFPSQVKFSVMEDCLPLAEEKFKKVIKDNYYTKNKFNTQLSPEQVKNLCKLFHEFSKKAPSKEDDGRQRILASSSGAQGKKRKRAEEIRRGGGASSLDPERSRRRGHREVRRSPVRRVREEVQRAPVIRGHEELRYAPVSRGHEGARHAAHVVGHEELTRAPLIRGHDEVRHVPVVIGERYHHPAVIYDRNAYLPPVDSASSLYHTSRAIDPALTRGYEYERAPRREDTYRRDPAVEYRAFQLSSSQEIRHPVELRHHDPYVLYRESRTRRAQEYEPDTRVPFGGRYAEYQSSLEHRAPAPLHFRY